MSETTTNAGMKCEKCGRDGLSTVVLVNGLRTCGYCYQDMAPTGIPLDGPGSHRWDLREMQAQRDRADKAEARLAASERREAEARERAERVERTLAGAKAVALGGDGMTHEQALAAVVGLVADLRAARERAEEACQGESERAVERDAARAEAAELRKKVEAALVPFRSGVWECGHGMSLRVPCVPDCEWNGMRTILGKGTT